MTMLSFSQAIFSFRDFLWSGPLLFLLVFVGSYVTWQLKGIQFTRLHQAFAVLIKGIKEKNPKHHAGDVSKFQSLMTALAGAIGTGNITGIASAVAIGGFGALFWMWVVAFLGMATAFAETVLAIQYRQYNEAGEIAGGPMYVLSRGLKMQKLAKLFALFGILVAFGLGALVQSNSVVDAIVHIVEIERIWLGVIIAIFTAGVVIGGIKTIGKVAGILVPFMAIAYLCAGSWVLLQHSDQILPAFQLIFQSAFTGQAATGGFLGATMMMAIQNGTQYGVFANEAGMGSLAIAGASADTQNPIEQGLMSIAGVFIATMVICTLTGLVLAVTQILQNQPEGTILLGSPLALAAFEQCHPNLHYVVLIGMVFFAFTTTLAWAYYGEKCIEYLLSHRWVEPFRWIYVVVVATGSVLALDIVWAMSHIANGLMAIPNLIGILLLTKVVKEKLQ